MRVVHLITGLQIGGAERALCRIVPRLAPRVDSHVISMLGHGPLADELTRAGVPVVCLDMRPGRPTASALWRCTRELRRLRPDLLQTWMYHADLLGLVSGIAARVPRIVWNIRASDMDLTPYGHVSSLTRRLCTWTSAIPAAVVVNSRAGRQAHRKLGYRAREWVLIPNGVDPEEFRPRATDRAAIRKELGCAETTVVIGLVARFDPVKGHDTFLRAAAQLTETGDDVHFVLIGEGATRDNPSFAALLAREAPGVRLTCFGSRNDVSRLLTGVDIATCSSVSEGFPNVVVENMASGVPCVVADVGDAAAIVGSTGLVVPAAAPDRLADAWRRLIALGPADRQALGQAARARVLEQFTLEKIVGQYEMLYTRLVGEARKKDDG
ncbi:MAG: glycosyltransferase [Luteitalea sp.]|nr:glycosyltransferase [Luteitalea sp.]